MSMDNEITEKEMWIISWSNYSEAKGEMYDLSEFNSLHHQWDKTTYYREVSGPTRAQGTYIDMPIVTS